MEVDGAQCTTSFDPSTYASTSNDATNLVIERQTNLAKSDTCTSLNLGADDGNIAEDIDMSNSRRGRLSEERDYSKKLEWETTAYFK